MVRVRHDPHLPQQNFTERRAQEEVDGSQALAPVISDERVLQCTARGLPVRVCLPGLALTGCKSYIWVSNLELTRSICYERYQAQLVSGSESRAVGDVGRGSDLAQIRLHHLEDMCRVAHRRKDG